MRVLIHGGGAVGLAVASCLLDSGAEVRILARSDTVSALDAEGLVRRGIFGDRRHLPGSYRASSELAALVAPEPNIDAGATRAGFDFILVCVKSFDTQAAAEGLRSALGPDLEGANVVLMQNGWGNREVFLNRAPAARVWNARVITGFRRPQPALTEITVHAEPVAMGDLDPAVDPSPLDPLARAIRGGGLPCEVTREVARDIWAKMLYNCALNPLGAILGVPYGALAETEATRSIMDSIIDEVFAVLLAAGHSVRWPDASAYREAFYGTLVPVTAAHRSSTLQDLEAGRRTEIDALCGAVVRLGSSYGVATPVNGTMWNLIRALESARGQPQSAPKAA